MLSLVYAKTHLLNVMLSVVYAVMHFIIVTTSVVMQSVIILIVGRHRQKLKRSIGITISILARLIQIATFWSRHGQILDKLLVLLWYCKQLQT